MYICVHIHICVYIFLTFVYLYLLVYNAFKYRHFNISLKYFEFGKHVCIFLHSLILWQIATYLLTDRLEALSKGKVAFIEGYIADSVIPEKNPHRGVVKYWRRFLQKCLEFLGLSL